jgi:hypothetical protein
MSATFYIEKDGAFNKALYFGFEYLYSVGHSVQAIMYGGFFEKS